MRQGSFDTKMGEGAGSAGPVGYTDKKAIRWVLHRTEGLIVSWGPIRRVVEGYSGANEAVKGRNAQYCPDSWNEERKKGTANGACLCVQCGVQCSVF